MKLIMWVISYFTCNKKSKEKKKHNIFSFQETASMQMKANNVIEKLKKKLELVKVFFVPLLLAV